MKKSPHPETSLRAFDDRVAANPDDVELRFRRAGLLAALGRFEAARADYLAVLARAPTHSGALNDLGSLLHARGFRDAARTCYAEAVAHHPGAPMPRVNLANMLLDDGDLEAARAHYETVLARAPHQAEAHQGLARILAELGEDEEAARHRQLGFRDRVLAERPYYGAGEGIPLLELVAAAGGNIPTRSLIDDRLYRCSVAVADFFDPAAALPGPGGGGVLLPAGGGAPAAPRGLQRDRRRRPRARRARGGGCAACRRHVTDHQPAADGAGDGARG